MKRDDCEETRKAEAKRVLTNIRPLACTTSPDNYLPLVSIYTSSTFIYTYMALEENKLLFYCVMAYNINRAFNSLLALTMASGNYFSYTKKILRGGDYMTIIYIFHIKAY